MPTETFKDEKRVALSPSAAQRLIKLGFNVNVQKGAGVASDFNDSEYEKIGAKIVSANEAIKSDLVLKVRPPSIEEANQLQDEGGLISFIQPAQNKDLVDVLK